MYVFCAKKSSLKVLKKLLVRCICYFSSLCVVLCYLLNIIIFCRIEKVIEDLEEIKDQIRIEDGSMTTEITKTVQSQQIASLEPAQGIK